VSALTRRPLGGSGINVSPLALGSWQTYERIPRERGAAVLARAREAGVDFLEVARYNDRTGTAPIPTGYSEVVFGEVFRASGWPRDEAFIANKLWWEFWPDQSAAQELEASLGRTGLDHFDFIYSDPPPAALPMEEVVAAVGELISSGKVRAWGIVNWPPERIAEAGRAAAAQGFPKPCAAQLVYSVVARSVVEGPAMTAALRECGAGVVASWTLAGGVLTGKYTSPGAVGRMTGELDSPRTQAAIAAVARLQALATELDTTPAALAIAFALANDDVATVLFGATSPEQVTENASALAVLDSLSRAQLDQLRDIAPNQART
jgi:aryl-alcohol dehydrogenase-like predicted oxidoreductase